MLVFAVALLVGELAAELLSPSLVSTTGAILVWLAAERWAPRPAGVARALAAAIIGAAITVRAATPPGGCWLPAAGEVRKAWLEGVVDGAAVALPDGVRIRLRARVVGPDLGSVCGSVMLTIAEPSADLRPGDRVRVHASLRRPVDFRNPRAYAYSRALAREGVWSTGGARTVRVLERPAPAPFAARLDRARARIREAIVRSAADPAAGLLRALVLGEQPAVGAATRETLSRAGLAHLLSVSGLHVAAVWGLAFACVRWLLARSEGLLLATDVRALAATAALLPACFYAALAGGSVPTERSIATAALGVAAWVVGRESGALHVLAVAAAAIALAHPGAPSTISFQLSFAAVLALVLASPATAPPADEDLRARLARQVLGTLRLSIAVTIATTPLVALHFQRAAPMGILTNPVLVPFLGIPATVLGLAGGAVALVSEPLARWPLASAGWLLARLVDVAAIAVSVPGASFRVPMPTGLELGIAHAAMALPWLTGRRRAFAILLIASLAIADGALWLRERHGRGVLAVRFLDVGQGDAAFLELPDGRVMVIDGGGLGRGTFDVGERVVAPALAARKIRRVDVLVATHGDRDHQAGLLFLARELSPREIWIVDSDAEADRLRTLVDTARASGARLRRLRAGDRIADESGVELECLHPPAGLVAESNDRSLVLRARWGERTILFTGDVEARAETSIQRAPDFRAVDVMKVPHHGSATSSGEAWLARARPGAAVVSVGAGNPYGAPSETVLRRHRRVGARVLRTDRDGSVLVVTDGRGLWVRTADEARPLVCSALGFLC